MCDYVTKKQRKLFDIPIHGRNKVSSPMIILIDLYTSYDKVKMEFAVKFLYILSDYCAMHFNCVRNSIIFKSLKGVKKNTIAIA